MLSSSLSIVCFVSFSGQILALEELPKVDDNNILTTEAAIRDTINTLFNKLGLRSVKTKPRLKEYSTVHNHLVSFTLEDYTNLREIAKLTRVDKMKINNETGNFMTVINELLNEDVVQEVTDATTVEVNDENVIKYIDQFLTVLESLKEQYKVTNENFHIKDEVYQLLKDDYSFPFNFSMNSSYQSDFEENDTLIDGSDFWRPDVSGRRIYRGDRTKIKYFPFMASIQIFNRFHCAGSIIKSDLIITASSCLQLAWNNRFFRENPAFLSVRVGSNFYNGGGESIPVLEVYFHPGYNPKNLRNNICLLRLVRKLHFKKRSRRLKKIDIDRRPSNLPMTTDGITIVGWGARGTSNIVKNPWENILAFAVLDFYPLQECQDIYSREYVTHKHFCAGFFSKGGGACNRDVGGPGIVNGILMGVISFGSPVCGTPDAPTVFTKLGYYTDWIEEIMEQEVYNARQPTTLKPKSLITLSQFYQPITSTTFKIAPLIGKKLEPPPISVVEALRVLKNEDLFQEFISTMFGANEAAQYQDLLQDNDIRDEEVIQLDETIMSKASESSGQVPKDTTPIEAFLEGPGQAVTEIGIVEPVTETPVTTSDENLIKVTALDENLTRLDNNKDLEADLVNLIDDIDLKEIIEGMPSVEEEKLLDDDKIIDLFKEKAKQKQMLKTDDSLLTLLYLSDNEKAANDNNNRNLDYDVGDDYTETGGLSIPADSFKDMTYRNSKKSRGWSDKPKTEMYYLISESKK